MRMGAVGLSSGLMYEPGMFSKTAEVIALARAVRPFGGLYDTHTRDPVMHFLESDQEALDIGRAAGIRVKIAHEKAVGLLNKGRIRDLIAMVEMQRAAGHEVVTDQYPYDGAQTMTLEDIILLPDVSFNESDPVALAAHRLDIHRALADKSLRDRMREATEHGVAGGYSVIKAVGYGSLRIVSSPDSRDLEGDNIQLLAEQRHMPPFDLIADLILKSAHTLQITIGSIDEADVQLLLLQPWDMIASDGGWVGPGEPGPDHPRTYGTYTRVLGHYSRDLHLLSLPEAVRKMTSLPADFLHLGDRGRVAVGQAADLTIFDPQTVADRATYVNPTVPSVGIHYVIVNGTVVLDRGVQTQATPGRLVTPTRH
jgi:N-acyl-D-aspartate/D-glutamate deacylase